MNGVILDRFFLCVSNLMSEICDHCNIVTDSEKQ